MVIAKARPDIGSRTNGNGVAATISPPAVVSDGRVLCPRCDTRLTFGYFEPQCPTCGYEDYHHLPPVDTNKKKSIVSSGSRFVLRYVGDFPALSETVAHVKIVRIRNRAVYSVRCPFCKTTMAQSSLSGKRRERREERYKCELGHRVSLTPGKNGMMGWK